MFYKNSKGDIIRKIAVHPNLKQSIEEGHTRFQELFGRSPVGRDLVLFEQFLNSERDFFTLTRQIGRNAGISDSKLFAWEYTGFILTEENMKIVPDIQIQEWEDAIDIYYEFVESDIDPYHVFTYLSPIGFEHYKECVKSIEDIIVCGFNALAKIRKPSSISDSIRTILLISALNSLRTINEFYKNIYSDDCLGILRGIYESYLRISEIRLTPDCAERYIQLAKIQTGENKFKIKKNGNPDYNYIVKPDGKLVRVTITNHAMASESDLPYEVEIYKQIYPTLSTYVHQDITEWLLQSSANGAITFDKHNDNIRAICYIIFVSLLIMRELYKFENLPNRTKRDVRFVTKRIIDRLQKLLSETSFLENVSFAPIIIPTLSYIDNEIK